ncbi:hypothetical protein G9A89_016481 [Geosiphon pyriformis]|nr:hypothetical protein G9A89_016481 [Geosiphon pyriformis]
MRIQKCKLMAPKTPGTGWLRPNPIEAFLVFEVLWMLGRMGFIGILWADLFRDRYLFREILQEFPETFGTIGLAWFAVGTYLQIGSHLNSKTRRWQPNSRLADRYLFMVTIAAPMFIWPVTAGSGYFRDNGQIALSDLLIGAHYMLSSVWHTFGALGVFYFGREICNMLRFHIEFARASNNITRVRLNNMESGLHKVKILSKQPGLSNILFTSSCLFMPICITIVVAVVSIRNKKIEQRPNGNLTSTSNFDSMYDDETATITSKTHLRRQKSKLTILPSLISYHSAMNSTEKGPKNDDESIEFQENKTEPLSPCRASTVIEMQHSEILKKPSQSLNPEFESAQPLYQSIPLDFVTDQTQGHSFSDFQRQEIVQDQLLSQGLVSVSDQNNPQSPFQSKDSLRKVNSEAWPEDWLGMSDFELESSSISYELDSGNEYYKVELDTLHEETQVPHSEPEDWHVIAGLTSPQLAHFQ